MRCHNHKSEIINHESTGFTLVELLVVITIIGILIALLLPAVQAAREAARRMQCCNHLKQLALSCHNYHTTNGTLPAAAYCDPSNYYGCHTWIEGLFPYIDQQSLYDLLDFKVNLATTPNKELLTNRVLPELMCPTDRFAGLLDRSALLPPPRPILSPSLGESYAPNGGPMDMGGGCLFSAWPDGRNCYPDRGGRGTYGTHGLFAPGDGIAYRFDDCLDGLSNAFLLGEQLPSRTMHGLYFHSHLTAATTNVPPNYHYVMDCPEEMPLDYTETCVFAMMGYKSDHPGGLNMAMADGSVHFVSETIEYRTWVFLGSRNDGESAQIQ